MRIKAREAGGHWAYPLFMAHVVYCSIKLSQKNLLCFLLIVLFLKKNNTNFLFFITNSLGRS